MANSEIVLFEVTIQNWGDPIHIRAYSIEDAIGVTRILFDIPSDVIITATAVIV